MNYCPECGFKIDNKFKFCPNCGSNIESAFSPVVQSDHQGKDYIICKNCGEKNPKENSECFSCGVSLNNINSKKQNKSGRGLKKNNKIYSATTNVKRNNKTSNEEKVLDNKKILTISVSILVIFVFALVASGVFDKGIQTETSQISNESSKTNSTSVNLENMEEINQLENKIKENPADLESTLHLAHLQQDAGLSEKAISNYKKYLAKFPENADARVDMAICYYNLNEYNTAITEMETAIKYQPAHQIAYLNLGIVNLAAKNIEASKEWFRKTVELDPNSEAGKRAAELMHSH